MTEVVEVKLIQRGRQDTGSRTQRHSRSRWGSETTKEQSWCENWARRERIRPGVNVWDMRTWAVEGDAAGVVPVLLSARFPWCWISIKIHSWGWNTSPAQGMQIVPEEVVRPGGESVWSKVSVEKPFSPSKVWKPPVGWGRHQQVTIYITGVIGQRGGGSARQSL